MEVQYIMKMDFQSSKTVFLLAIMQKMAVILHYLLSYSNFSRKKKNDDTLFSLQQEEYNLSELTGCPDFNFLSMNQRNCLLACYKAVMPDSVMNLLDGVLE